MATDDEIKNDGEEIIDGVEDLTEDTGGEISLEEEEENAQALVKKLREKLKKCETEKQEYMNGWQRERADFVNFKKRADEEKKEYIKFANENLLEEMLAVLESFDMAFMNKEAWNSVPANWRTGVEYIHSQLVKILDENGLKEFMPKIGDKFDPHLHIAEEMMPTDNKDKEGTIMSVKRKGYTMNGKVVISPKVAVAEASS